MVSLAVIFVFGTLLHLSHAFETVNSQERLFEIDYENDQFLKDGEPFRYVSGSLHYFRVPRPYWSDRLRKYRAAGLNAICTYIEWSRHEPLPGVYDFSGQNDFEHFVQLAQEEGLLVILRPGPYICAERDFGGYPTWLLHENPYMGLRTNETSHTKFVYSWLSVLFPRIQPLLYGNGGPVIMVQVENEYGSYVTCDRDYTLWLRDVFRGYVGDKAVLFTTDGSGTGYLECGPIPGVFITVDFGTTNNVTRAFEPLRQVQKHGPLVNSEFYAGWLTHWGDDGAAFVSTKSVVNTTRQLLAVNASFNFYMFHGGTNFGFTSGANNPPFAPQITSYDYDAPISEWGNLTDKYYAIRSVISEFLPLGRVPHQTYPPPADYGVLTLLHKTALFDTTGIKYGTFQYPRTFESLQQYTGFMLYETILPPGYSGRGYLEANNTHDRTIVYVNKKPAGVLSRSEELYSLIIGGKGGQPLSLLVENQGHINYGYMSDLKGLVDNVTLEGDILTGWKHTGYPLTDASYVASLPTMSILSTVHFPAFFAASFHIPSNCTTPPDTFVDMSGWRKGILFVNGHNLGRYWPGEGPQATLYLPGPLLRKHAPNTVVVLELEKSHPNRTIRLVSKPIFTGSLEYEFVEEFNEVETLKGITAQVVGNE